MRPGGIGPQPQFTGGTGFQPVRGFRGTRRNLPHLEEAGRTYFVTFRTAGMRLPDEARKIVFDACLYWRKNKYRLHACVVMPDHVHLLITPLGSEKGEGVCSLSEIMHSIKSYSSNRINRLLGRRGTLWLDENHDRIMRSEEEVLEKLNYTRNNPVRWGLVQQPNDYPFLYDKCQEDGDLNETRGQAE